MLAFKTRLVMTLLVLALCIQGFSQGIVYPDFTVSMIREGRSLGNYENMFVNKHKLQDSIHHSKYLEIFRNLYARNIIAARYDKYAENVRIPRIVHQIWLGSPPPQKYEKWMRSWMNWNGWEYILWTDEDLKDFVLYNQDLYEKASNYGEKSDILRLEILHNYGGVYVDVDYECLKPEVFEELHKSFDFYIGFEPLEHGILDDYKMFKACNALIGSSPKHPLMQEFILNMKDNCKMHETEWTVEKTGPAYLSREIFAYEFHNLYSQYRNMYLPSTFFYPISEPEMRCTAFLDILSILSPETAAIHYWSGSWWKGRSDSYGE